MELRTRLHHALPPERCWISTRFDEILIVVNTTARNSLDNSPFQSSKAPSIDKSASFKRRMGQRFDSNGWKNRSFDGETGPHPRRRLLTEFCKVCGYGQLEPGVTAVKQKFIAIVLAAAVALIVAPAALAGRDDSALRTPWFGPVFMGPTTSIFSGDFSLTVESEVRFDGTTGEYTYFYELTSSTANDSITSFFVMGAWLPADLTQLNWGIITSETTDTVALDPEPVAVIYADGQLTANLSDGPRIPGTNALGGLDVEETLVFYAQSTRGPALMSSGAFVSEGSAEGLAFGPIILQQVPEPASAMLLGSGLLGLLALHARSRKISVAA